MWLSILINKFVEYIILMRKAAEKEGQVIEFSHLSNDHRAEFIQFLLKNNICFQEGKDNCVAKVTVKQNNAPQNSVNNIKRKPLKEREIHNNVSNANTDKVKMQPRRQILIKDCNTTPIKNKNQASHIFQSSLSCKTKRESTIKRISEKTPKNKKERQSYSPNKLINSLKKNVKQNRNIVKNQRKADDFKENSHLNVLSPKSMITKSCQKSRNKTINKYLSLFDWGLGSQRPVRMPAALLQKTGEEIYDQIFAKNTQYLQHKNIGAAFKTLSQNKFCILIDEYFRKKFKSSKQISANLSNFLYSLAYYCEKEKPSQFMSTFEGFIMQKYDYQDLLFYLFARSIVKKQIKCQKKSSIKSFQYQLSNEVLRIKQINKLLKCIVGSQSDLFQSYRSMVFSSLSNDEINVYGLLRILLQDYRIKRLSSLDGFNDKNYDSFGNTCGSKEFQYQRKNTQQLTFGDEYEHDSDKDNSEMIHQDTNYQPHFWRCQSYSCINDSLFDLISQKMERKSKQLLTILVADDELQHNAPIIKLQSDLIQKSKSLVKSIFQMNKIKWFRQLGIQNPNEDDIEKVEEMQIRLKDLKKNPNAKEIGQFCKAILTVKELINQLEASLSNQIRY